VKHVSGGRRKNILHRAIHKVCPACPVSMNIYKPRGNIIAPGINYSVKGQVITCHMGDNPVFNIKVFSVFN
jgi:hypothetical protein